MKGMSNPSLVPDSALMGGPISGDTTPYDARPGGQGWVGDITMDKPETWPYMTIDLTRPDEDPILIYKVDLNVTGLNMVSDRMLPEDSPMRLVSLFAFLGLPPDKRSYIRPNKST